MSSKTQKSSDLGGLGSAIDDVASSLDDWTRRPDPTAILTRQGNTPSWRTGTTTRNVMKWLAPNQPMIEMYVNPESFIATYKKHISSPTRTKGGFIVQYWGEDLTTLSLTGTTGSSGIEGINILNDIYRAEQVSLDPYALFLQSQNTANEQDAFNTILNDTGITAVSGALDLLRGAKQGYSNPNNIPTLASLAFTVELYWSGEVYRGYFNNITVTESAQKLGLFDYSIGFTVTQKRGIRLNYMPWHKSPTDGGNVIPKLRPYSFGALQTDNGINRIPNFGNVHFQDITEWTTKNKNTLNAAADAVLADTFKNTNT